MSILKQEITVTHYNKLPKIAKKQPTEKKNNVKYRNISQVGPGFHLYLANGVVRNRAPQK